MDYTQPLTNQIRFSLVSEVMWSYIVVRHGEERNWQNAKHCLKQDTDTETLTCKEVKFIETLLNSRAAQWSVVTGSHSRKYKVVQIWPEQTVTCLHTISPGHIWTTLYILSTMRPISKAKSLEMLVRFVIDILLKSLILLCKARVQDITLLYMNEAVRA